MARHKLTRRQKEMRKAYKEKRRQHDGNMLPNGDKIIATQPNHKHPIKRNEDPPSIKVVKEQAVNAIMDKMEAGATESELDTLWAEYADEYL